MAIQNRKGSNRTARRRRPWTLGAGIAAVVVVAVSVGYFAYRAQADLPGQKFSDQGNLHVQTLGDPHEPYNSTPPTSGPHLPYIAPWGIHTRPIPNELQVHNLEDAGVVIQYNCTCPEIVEKLSAIVRKYPTQILLAPYPTMQSRIALTAWTRLETMDNVDEARIERFIRAYRGIDHHPPGGLR
jgi:Protein of unknown function (DUF3105)